MTTGDDSSSFFFFNVCENICDQVYLIDEPSAYLDSEQRIAASKVIKRFIMHAKKTAFVVEHDFIMARQPRCPPSSDTSEPST